MKNIIKEIILINQNGMDSGGNLWDSAEDYLAEKIVDGLTRQIFYDWYNNGNFNAYITGEKPLPKQQIIENVKTLFK